MISIIACADHEEELNNLIRDLMLNGWYCDGGYFKGTKYDWCQAMFPSRKLSKW